MYSAQLMAVVNLISSLQGVLSNLITGFILHIGDWMLVFMVPAILQMIGMLISMLLNSRYGSADLYTRRTQILEIEVMDEESIKPLQET